jgi:ubiquinone/menaquinone biosynthesis C-methylase UbiE
MWGCGTGWFTRRVADDGAQVVGLDRDVEALAFAGQHSAGGTSYLHGDATSLSFADASFDAVLSVTALFFVEHWSRALAEIVRVSRRRFVLGLPNRHSPLWLDTGREGAAEPIVGRIGTRARCQRGAHRRPRQHRHLQVCRDQAGY